jgi:type II secretory pathway component PulL
MMALGFVRKSEDTFLLYIFERSQDGYSLLEKKELKPGDAYLTDLTGRLDIIYLDVPSKHIHYRILKLPFSDREKINDIIPFQLEGMIAESIDSIVYDFMILDKVEDNFRIVVVFALRDYLKQMLDTLSIHGIRPEVITSVESFRALSEGSAEKLALAGSEALSEETAVQTMTLIFATQTINLAQGELSYRKDVERAKRHFRVTAVLVLVLAVLLAAHFLLDAGNMRMREKGLKQDMIKMYSRLIPGDKKIIDPLYQLKSQMKQIEWKNQEINDTRPLAVLDKVAESWKSGRSAESIKITPDLITLTGEAESAGEVKAIADSLPFENSSKPVIETKQTSGGKTGYTIQIKIGKGQ